MLRSHHSLRELPLILENEGDGHRRVQRFLGGLK